MRTPTVVNLILLRSCIEEVEKDGGLSNRDSLHKAVSFLYNSKKGIEEKEISHSIVLLRIASEGIQVKTLMGKRRSSIAEPEIDSNGQPVVRIKVIRASEVNVVKVEGEWDEIIATTPKGLLPLLNKCMEGNKKAKDKLRCLRCTGYKRDLIRNCSAKTCIDYNSRPYKTIEDDEEDSFVEPKDAPTENELLIEQGKAHLVDKY